MSSVHQEIPWAGHANYAASKGGIKLMMESLRRKSRRDISASTASPPARSVRRSIRPRGNTKAAYDSLMKLVPYGRIGEPEDIGRAAVWLASDDSDYVVGTTLFRRWRHDTLSGLRDRWLSPDGRNARAPGRIAMTRYDIIVSAAAPAAPRWCIPAGAHRQADPFARAR
jgi:NAD(P)-dependent dehydrogenase (short-subunit alcohol dehydrogenase family)